MKPIPEGDLQHILDRTAGIWPKIAGRSVLLTGGTGFFGKWLTAAFIYIDKRLALNAKLYILSRDPQKFTLEHPYFDHENITYIKGDIADFQFGDGPLDYIIHAATEASATLNANEPALMFDTIVEGTRNVLELARKKQVDSVLLTSSGAVYGVQPSIISHLSETDTFAPNVLAGDAAYGEGKRVAEMLCAMYHRQHGLNVKIARCFAFAGPYLPLNAHYAFGNFVKNALEYDDITIAGDGTPRRSYLYAADLVIWLWTILINGRSNEAYNVGSDQDISVLGLAEKISTFGDGRSRVETKQKPRPDLAPSRYVPNIEKAKEELGLGVYIDLDEALKRTFDFYRSTTTNNTSS